MPSTSKPAPSEEERVNAWRLERFIELGYTPLSAQLAVGLKLDPHEVSDLINRGCPRDLALHIVR